MDAYTSLPPLTEPIVIGADRVLRFSLIEDLDDTAVDLSSADLAFTIHECTGKDTIAPIPMVTLAVGSGIEVIDAVGGIVEVTISASDGPALTKGDRPYAAVLRLQLTDSEGLITWPVTLEAVVRPY